MGSRQGCGPSGGSRGESVSLPLVASVAVGFLSQGPQHGDLQGQYPQVSLCLHSTFSAVCLGIKSPSASVL